MSDIKSVDDEKISAALARVGKNKELCKRVFQVLREAEACADNAVTFRNEVRWPLIFGILRDVKTCQVALANGLIFDVGLDSRIEQALLLSSMEYPDHVWEPQTTKLLVKLGTEASNVIVGGAYIGDHVLPIAYGMSKKNRDGQVHAFEPMQQAFGRLLRHLELNKVTNVVPHQLALWDKSDVLLDINGDAALASTLPHYEEQVDLSEVVHSLTIDDYIESRQLSSVGLIMLDTEGAEEKALLGASHLLSRPFPDAPHLIFEVHRNYVDWSNGLENTSIVKLAMSNGYKVFAIRDFHDNYPMTDKVIEIVPVDDIYLEGPPHGFNLFATKDSGLVARMGLRVVKGVSPKLLVDKNPALHHPSEGL